MSFTKHTKSKRTRCYHGAFITRCPMCKKLRAAEVKVAYEARCKGGRVKVKSKCVECLILFREPPKVLLDNGLEEGPDEYCPECKAQVVARLTLRQNTPIAKLGQRGAKIRIKPGPFDKQAYRSYA